MMAEETYILKSILRTLRTTKESPLLTKTTLLFSILHPQTTFVCHHISITEWPLVETMANRPRYSTQGRKYNVKYHLHHTPLS